MKIGITVECAVCGNMKQPVGRDASGHAHYCTRYTCEGYDQEPFAGSLWPGESEEDFGYPVSSRGTTTVDGSGGQA